MRKIHSIGTISQRTGLSPHVIRAWERRYEAVSPERSEGNQRLYSEADLERLALLKRATEAGMGISRATQLDNDQIRDFVRQSGMAMSGPPAQRSEEQDSTIDELKAAAYDHIQALDQAGLFQLLNEATYQHGLASVLDNLVADIMVTVGEQWRSGGLRIFHEHLASSVIRSFLGKVLESATIGEERPLLVATTPSGQLHELGALWCAAVATTEHIRALYIGANTPAEETIRVVESRSARVLALSVYYPPNDTRVLEDLRKIREAMPTTVRMLLGGYAAEWYSERLGGAAVELIHDASELRELLLHVS